MKYFQKHQSLSETRKNAGKKWTLSNTSHARINFHQDVLILRLSFVKIIAYHRLSTLSRMSVKFFNTFLFYTELLSFNGTQWSDHVAASYGLTNVTKC